MVDSGQLFVAVRASGAGHRGGTLTMLTADGDFGSDDPVLTVGDRSQAQVFALTNDGLTGFRRVGGSAGTRLVPDLAVSLPSPTDAGRSYSFQLRPGIRYSTGALVRPQDFRRTIERTLRLVRGLGLLRRHRRGAWLPGRPEEAVRPLEGDRDRRRPRTPSPSISPPPTPTSSTSSLSPTRTRCPPARRSIPHGPLPATGPYEIASFDTVRGIRLVRNPRFHEWSQAAQPSGFPDEIVERYGGSPDAHVSAVLHGAADLASDASDARRRPCSPLYGHSTRASSRLNPWDITWLPRAEYPDPAPFDDVRVRRALNFAVDREHLRDLTVGQGLGQVTCQVLPPDLDGYRRYCPYTAEPTKTGAWTAPDLARARSSCAPRAPPARPSRSGCPTSYPVQRRRRQYVVSVLDSLGYKARLRLRKFEPLPQGEQAPPPARLLRLGPGLRRDAGRLHPPGTRLQRLQPGDLPERGRAEFCDPSIDREMARARVAPGKRSRGRVATVGQDRPRPHRPGTLGPVRKRRRARGRLQAGRQLPVQPATRHAARPALGEMTCWVAGATRCSSGSILWQECHGSAFAQVR